MRAELQKKVDFAIRLLRNAEKMAEKVGQPVEIAYSGGKDSDVILELAKMSGINYRAIYKNTTIDPAGTIAHAREMGAEVMQPKQTFYQLIEQNGMPNRWRRFCCGVLKEYKILDYMVVGVRRSESRARAERYQEPEICRTYKKGVTARQYMPILEWSADDITEFINERGIKCHPLYYDEQGVFHAERRLGCMCCPLQSRQKRIASFKEHPKMVRFYIKAAKKYLETHKGSKIAKSFQNNAYDWFTSQTFCDGERQFREMFGPTLFDDGIDTKKYLENYFGVEL